MTAADSMIVDHTKIGAALRRLSLPLALQMLGDQLLGVVDTIAIGYISTGALAGVTAATTVFFALILLINGLWSGLGIIAAQRIGAHDVDGFARTVRAGWVVPGIAAMLLTGASVFGAEPLLHLMLGNLPSVHASAAYLVLRCASLVPIDVSATLIVGLGAAGNRKLGVYILGVINLIHIPLLAVLALGWLTHRPFGIVGAGISTLTSETIAALFALMYVARKPVYRIFAQRTVDLALALRCAWLGLPESVFGFAIAAPDVAVVAMLAPLGATVVAAFRALNVVSDLTFVVPVPLQSATQTVIGQRIGARDPAGAKSFLHRALNAALVVTTITGVLVALASWPLAYLFTMNAAVASVAALPIAVHMITLPLKGWAMVALAPIRAAGDTKFSMAVGLVCGLLVLPIAWLAIERLRIGLYSVPVAWIIAWSVRVALTARKLRYSAGAWTSSIIEPRP
ncbi:MAG TPA: MATE family efflux transporter [Candidatus Baltobacteraceae bacterium]|nr:MATE family efflux transporter [Candidatus Baltobacteraceae bacterium]